MPTPSELLDAWLTARLTVEGKEWLAKVCEIGASGNASRFHLGFSQIPRKLGVAPLGLTEAEQAAAGDARRGWQPSYWSVDQAARARGLLALGSLPDDRYFTTFDQLFADADLGELIALYRALAIAPYPDRLVERAAEGLRSNMKAVFEAVAQHNPYPADFLSEAAFNQLVLKCLFVGATLDSVWDVDRRINRVLALMLCDYARERWAAGRSVSPELWRCVGPVADAEMLALMARVFGQGNELDQSAVVLACVRNPKAEALIGQRPDLTLRAQRGELDWSSLARQYSA